MRGLIPVEAMVRVYMCRGWGWGEPHHQREPKAQCEWWGENLEVLQAARQGPLPTLDPSPQHRPGTRPPHLASRRPGPSVWAVRLPRGGLALRYSPPFLGTYW